MSELGGRVVRGDTHIPNAWCDGGQMCPGYRADDDDAMRDRAAEAWLIARHKPGWYIGEATASEWIDAYTAVDEGGCAACGSYLHFTNEHLNPGEYD